MEFSAARSTVQRTGRREPRCAYLATIRGEQLGLARRTDPPERRASLVSSNPFSSVSSGTGVALLSVSVTALPLAAAAVGYVLLGVAIAIVLVALAVVIFRRPPPRRRKPRPPADLPERRDAATSLSTRLANTNDAESIARVLVYEMLIQLGVDVAAVAEISDDRKLARGLYAYGPDVDLDWWRSVQLDLENDPTAIASVAYEASLFPGGGTPPYSWSHVAGTLPPGLSVQASPGRVLGTPTTAGTFTLTVRVNDSGGQTASQQFNIRILP